MLSWDRRVLAFGANKGSGTCATLCTRVRRCTSSCLHFDVGLDVAEINISRPPHVLRILPRAMDALP